MVNDNHSTEDTPDEDTASEEFSSENDAIELPDDTDDFGALSEQYEDELEETEDVAQEISVESVEEEEEDSVQSDITLEDAEDMAEAIVEVEELSDEVAESEEHSHSTELELELKSNRPVVLSDTLSDDEVEEDSQEEYEYEDEEYDSNDESVEPAIEEESILDDSPKSRILWFLSPIVLLGILVRIAWYIKNPAFVLDEADVTSELMSRSIGELFQVLGEHQCAPIAYLLTVKLSTLCFGYSEYALRAYPLIATVLGLVFFAWLARRMVEPLSAVLATCIVAFSWPVIHYAAEFKQYGNDVMASALMLALGYTYLSKPMSKKDILLFSIVGAVLQWYSLPILFVLAGVGFTLGVHSLFAGEWGKVKGLLLVALVWLLSFALNYFVSLKEYAVEGSLRSMHYESYCLLPPARDWPTVIRWVGETSTAIFSDPLGIILPGLGVLTFLFGVLVMARTQRVALSMVLLPVLGVLLASMAQRYPFHGRFLQFLVPSFAICCAVGLSGLLQLLWTARRRTALVLGILFFLPSIAVIVNHLMKPAPQGLRPVVNFWQEHLEAEDLTYIDHWVRNEFKYYTREEEDVDLDQVHVGISTRNDWSHYESIMNEYQGNDRVWFMLQDHDWHLSVGERQFFETRLSALGKQLEHQVWGEYHLYLYELSSPQEEASPVDNESPSDDGVPEEAPAIDGAAPDSDTPSGDTIDPPEIE